MVVVVVVVVFLVRLHLLTYLPPPFISAAAVLTQDVHFSYPTRPHASVLGGLTLEVRFDSLALKRQKNNTTPNVVVRSLLHFSGGTARSDDCTKALALAEVPQAKPRPGEQKKKKKKEENKKSPEDSLSDAALRSDA